LGNLANALIISYAILRHQLLDIRLVIQRGLVYTVLSVGLTSVYLLVLFGAQALFQSSGFASLALATVVALAVALIFAPLRNLTQERVDRLLFREMFEYRRMLVKFHSNVSNALDLERLAYDILDPLTDTLDARWAALLLSDVDSGDFRVRFVRRKDTEDGVSGLRLRRSSPLLSLLAHEQGVLHEELLDTYPEGLALWETERNDLKTHGVDLLCPMVSRGSLAGILLLGGKHSGRMYSDEDQGLVLTMASGAALALDNARMLDDLKRQQHRADELLSQMVQAQEQERERVALELHDGVAQWLVRASYQAQICKALLAREDSTDIQSELNEVEDTVDESLRELRRVLAGLRPPTLDELGLTHALRNEAEQLNSDGVSCRVEMEGEAVRLSSTVEIAVYRIVQEALNNVRKHAKATQATLRLHFEEDYLRVEVIDDGKGFNVARILESAIAEQHMGLLGMKQRVEWLGGALKLESSEDAGTHVTVRVPVASAA
ncbi:MAG: GAF domain-containing sensor histidine kinase, partial [Chloroflexi bacterium]|nr:GAF domain-containing sensor histidine kinase [Chloroflexota bacterium]